jgi:hypothetical protein
MDDETAKAAKILFEAHRTAQEKYTYFLLAAAGAAIGFAATQTRDALLAWSQAPLALAILAWGLSFFFGCRQIRYVQSSLYANSELLRVQAGRHPKAGIHPDVIAAASAGISSAMESNAERASFFTRWQFNCLILGAIMYVGWHVLEMYLRQRG